MRACSQAGLVNNLNDALAWGLAPLYLAANGASVTEVGVVAAVYPAVWGAGQLATGWLSDHTGRKPLIVLGMLVQAGRWRSWSRAAAPSRRPSARPSCSERERLVYPTLIAAVSDVSQPVERAQLVGVYRFWRDFGFVVGAVIAGLVADGFGADWSIAVVAALTGASGLWVAMTRWARSLGRCDTRSANFARAQQRIAPRLDPEEAHRAMADGAVLVDLRSHDERRLQESFPGRCTFRAPCSSGASTPTRATRTRTSRQSTAASFSSVPRGLLELRCGEPARARMQPRDRHRRRLRRVEGGRPSGARTR